MIQTFLHNPDDQEGEIVAISGSEARHIISVLRLRKGDSLRLTDGAGTTHLCQIDNFKKNRVLCRIIKTMRKSGEPEIKLALAAGLSAATKFDTVLEKGTEIGVSTFLPLLTEKSKVKLGDKAAVGRKMNRWKRVVAAALKQSGRSVLPYISEPVGFAEFINRTDPEKTFLFHPQGKYIDSKLIPRDVSEITVVIGPESGFSPEETEIARDRGIRIFSLGERILRAETAAIAISALFIYRD